jgi:phospholipase C
LWRTGLLMMVITLLLIPSQIWAGDDGHRGIKNIIVIYQENWSFDSLYGLYPGANGISRASQVSLTQLDRLTGQPYTSQLDQPFDLVSGSLTLTTPPQPINNGAIDNRFPANFNTLVPYDLVDDAGLQTSDKTGDIVHRFWHEQSQINHGKMNEKVI